MTKSKYLQAKVYEDFFLWRQLVQVCKEILNDDTESAEAQLMLANAYDELLQFPNANGIYNELFQQKQTNLHYKYYAAVSAIKIKKYELAFKSINDILIILNDNTIESDKTYINDYYYYRSNISLLLGEIDNAIKDINRITSNDNYYSIQPLVISNESIKYYKLSNNLLSITTNILQQLIKYYHYIIITYGNIPIVLFLMSSVYKALGNMNYYKIALQLLNKTSKTFLKEFVDPENESCLFDMYFDPFNILWLQIELMEQMFIHKIENKIQFAEQFFQNEVKRQKTMSAFHNDEKHIKLYRMTRIYYAESLRINSNSDKALEIIQEIYNEDTINPYASLIEGHIKREKLDFNKAIECYTYSSRSLRRKKMELDMYGNPNGNKTNEIYNKEKNIKYKKWYNEHLLQYSMSCLAAAYRTCGRDVDSDNIIAEGEKYSDNNNSTLHLLYQKCVNLFNHGTPAKIEKELELFIYKMNIKDNEKEEKEPSLIFKSGIRNSEGSFMLSYPLFYTEYMNRLNLTIENEILIDNADKSIEDPHELWKEAYKSFFSDDFLTSYTYIEKLKNKFPNYENTLTHLLIQIRNKKYKDINDMKPKDFEVIINTSDLLVDRYREIKDYKNISFELLYSDLSKALLVFPGQVDGRWERALLLKNNNLLELSKHDILICIDQTKKELKLEGLKLEQVKKLRLRLITFQIELGLNCRKLGDLPKAINYFSDVIKSDATDPCARSHRAFSYVLQGNYGLAISDIEVCVKSCEDSTKLVDERYEPFVNSRMKLKYYIQLAALNAFIGNSCKILYDTYHNYDSVFDKNIFNQPLLKLPSKSDRGTNTVLNPSIDIIINQYYFQKAYFNFVKAEAIDPNYPDLHYFEGLMYLKCNLIDESISEFSRCIDLDSSHFESLFARGCLYISKKEYGKAITDLDDACTKNNNIKGIHTALGLVYFFLEDYQQSIEHFDEALKQNSEDLDALYLCGCTFLKIHILDKAIAYFNKVLEKSPKDTDAYMKKGYALSLQKKYTESLDCFSECLKYIKNDLTIYEYHAQAYYLMFDMKLAIDEYTTLLGQKFDDNLSNIAGNRGLTYNTLRDYKKAMMDYETAVRMNDKNPFARLYRALGYIKEKDLESALSDLAIAAPELKKIAAAESYEKEILNSLSIIHVTSDGDREQLKPDNIEDYKGKFSIIHLSQVYNLLGLLYQGNNQYQKALESFSYCVELDPSNYDAIYNKGVIYYETKDYKNALDQFQECVNAKPLFLEAVSNLGVSELQNKMLDKARMSFVQALGICEENGINLKFKSMLYYNLGNVCRLKENYDEAIVYFTKALEITPDDFIIYENRGCCHHCKYRVKEALEDYNKAIELQEENKGNNNGEISSELLMNRAQLYIFQLNYYNALEDLNVVINSCEVKGDYSEIYQHGLKLYNYCKYWEWSLAVGCKDFIAVMSIIPGIKNLSTTEPNLDPDIFHPPNLLDPYSHESKFISESLSLLDVEDNLYKFITLAVHHTKTMEYDKSITPLYQALYLCPIGTQVRHIIGIWLARMEEIYNNNIMNSINTLTSVIKTECRYLDGLPAGDPNRGPLNESLSQLYTYLGNLLEIQNKPGEALRCYEAGLERDNEYIFCLINLCYLLIRNGNFKPALNHMVKICLLQSRILKEGIDENELKANEEEKEEENEEVKEEKEEKKEEEKNIKLKIEVNDDEEDNKEKEKRELEEERIREKEESKNENHKLTVSKKVYKLYLILQEYNGLMCESTLNIQRLSHVQGKLAREMQELKNAIEIAEDDHYDARHKPLSKEMKKTMREYTKAIMENVYLIIY